MRRIVRNTAFASVAAVGLALATLSAPALAKGDDDASAASGAPSRLLERAIKLYENKDYFSATIELKKVLSGEGNDDASNKQRAEFFMGKAFYNMKLYAAALAYFDKIAKAGSAHAYNAPTLKWLAGLSRVLPETSGILEKIGAYDPSALDEPSLREVRDELNFLLGRHHYRRGGDGDFEKAISFFDRVSRESSYFIKAKFFAGVTYVRKYEGKPAIDAFKEILVIGEERPKQYTAQEIEEYVALAQLQMARVFYSTQQFDASIKYYEKLDQRSPDWTRSLFEASWAYFMKNMNSKALGNIHTLNAPYFETEFFPESMLLRSVIFFKYCQFDRAQESIQEYEQKYRPLSENLKSVLAKAEDNAEFYEYVKKVMGKKAGLDDATQRLVMSVLTDRTVKKTFAWVDQLQRELDRLAKSDKAWQNTLVASEVLQELTLQKSLAEADAGKVARDRIDRLQRELASLSRDGAKIKFEILNAKADKLSAEAMGTRIKKGSKEEPIVVDDEHFEWRFNGEYWKDELGYYRFKIRSECKE